MKNGVLSILWRGHSFHLLPEKALYWPALDCLLIADIHLGKTAHFRKAGLAVPPGIAETNLRNLYAVVENYSPKTIFLMGDLFHSQLNTAWESFTEISHHFSHIEFELILGNHDILSDDLYKQARLSVSVSKKVGDLLLTHQPMKTVPGNMGNIAGHIHPGVHLRGKGKQSVALACFYFSENQAILPAFGAFTGFHTLRPKPQDKIFLVVENTVLDASSLSDNSTAWV